MVLLEVDVSHSIPNTNDIANEHNAKLPNGTPEPVHYKDWPNAAGFDAHEESRTPRPLKVTGQFPSWVAGSLLRTGPSESRIPRQNVEDPDYQVSHWFDGFTRIHKFDISHTPSGESKVHYTSRGQVDTLLEKARKDGRLEGFSFGQKRDPCDSFYKKLKTTFELPKDYGTEGANIGVAFAPKAYGGDVSKNQVTVTTDSSAMKALDMDTLEPMGVVRQTKLHKSLKGQLSGAHAAFDPQTGDVFNYNLEFGRNATYRVFKTDAKLGETTILATIAGKDIKPAYVHSMFITENFVVLVIWPAYVQANGLSVLWNRNILESLKFDKTAKTTWCVVDRRHGRGLVQKFTSPAMFSFHTINAWEEKKDDQEVDLVCELCQFPTMDILHRFYYDNLISTGAGVRRYHPGDLDSFSPSIVQYKLQGVSTMANRSKSAAPKTAEVINAIKIPGDLPTINPRYATQKHRFVYCAIDRGLSSFIDGISKTDTETGKNIIWEHPKHTPGEPVFLPNPQGQAEDDGVVLVVVFNGETSKSYLLCLDAKDFTELARADVESAVGFGFHGRHVSS